MWMTLLIVKKKKNQSAFKAIERKNQRGTSACMASWQRDKVCTSCQLLHGAGDSPAHTCTSEVVREIPRHSTEEKGALCKGRVRHHRSKQREVRINNNNNSNKNNGQLLSPSDFRVCCGQNTAQTNPMKSASEPQGLFSGFVGPPPEILIPSHEARPRLCMFNECPRFT